MTAEYDWTLMKWVSLATFIDAGKVAPDWQDIRASGLKHGYGFGARVHSNKQTFARVDVGAGGGEGWRVFLELQAQASDTIDSLTIDAALPTCPPQRGVSSLARRVLRSA